MEDDLLSSMLVPDPVIAAYMKDVDRTLLRENLKLSPEERVRRGESFMNGIFKLRREQAARRQAVIARE